MRPSRAGANYRSHLWMDRRRHGGPVIRNIDRTNAVRQALRSPFTMNLSA